jgi:hypothetical protein
MQTARWLGVALLMVAAAGGAYLFAANWTSVGPVLAGALRAGLLALSKPGVQALLFASVFAALVLRLTRRPKNTADKEAASERPGSFWGGALLSLVLMGGLVAQSAYFFRTEIATLAPVARPQMERACAWVGCTIPLPRRSDLVSIESSDLHPVQGRRDQLQLFASVRNRASYRQDWPHLEVTLTDTRDKPVVRRVFAPEEYLPEQHKSAPGFDSNQELQLELTLQVESAAAAGYRIYVFYP